VLVNATPLGMHGELLPAPFRRLEAGQVAYDLVYDPFDTPFVVAARERGAGAHHGLGMLVAQAAVSYQLWTGRVAPMEVLAEVAADAVAERSAGTVAERPSGAER
jgi:shikimate dehydrogenase